MTDPQSGLMCCHDEQGLKNIKEPEEGPSINKGPSSFAKTFCATTCEVVVPGTWGKLEWGLVDVWNIGPIY